MKKKNLGTIIGLVVIGLLLAMAVVVDIIRITENTSVWPCVLSIAGTLLVLFYFIFGYKKPHSNILKYIFLIYALGLGCYGLYRCDKYPYMTYCYLGAVILISYMAGRLDRITENIAISIIVFILVLYGFIYKSTVKEMDPLESMTLAGELYQWIALAIIYITRYFGHREAGKIADKSE